MLNKLFPFIDFLYLLQLEEYDSKRYLRLIPRFFFRREFQKRQRLVFTSRIKTTLVLSILLMFSGVLIFFVFTILLIPIWVLIANIILDPIYLKIKLNIQKKAAKYFADNFKVKVIAVAGSY